MTTPDFVRLVDHTILKPETTSAQVRQVAAEALELRTASVCVNGRWVSLVSELLADSPVLTCSVVGFPLGATSEGTLAFETAEARRAGADEIDMVLPVGLLKEGAEKEVLSYIKAARDAADQAVLKVILETAILTEDEIRRACELSVQAQADFVKTSTGFNAAGGATVDAVRLMRSVVGPDIGVKASGGIRSYADVQEMLEAGASRLGLSSTVAIAQET